MSEVDSDLIDSYIATVFRVWDSSSRITFQVEAHNRELDSLLKTIGAQTAAFITAHNPGSQVLDPDDNDRAHEALIGELRARGLRWLEGDGVDPYGKWSSETSVMVLDIDQLSATAIAMQFGQNAYVWIHVGDPARLVFTR